MTVLYRERPKHRAKFENRIAKHLESMNGPSAKSQQELKLVPLAKLAISKVAKETMIAQQHELRNQKSRPSKSSRLRHSIAKFLQQVDQVCASNPVVLRRIVTLDGTIYPLRTEVTVVLKHAVRTAEAFVHELRWLTTLFGKGPSDDLAITAFSESFHNLVKTHHRKPPHLRTPEDERINRVLDHLIDWRRFDIENPIDQPLWGRIGRRDQHGNLWVFWICGPDGSSKIESPIYASDVVGELDELREGSWFYGAGRVFPGRIEWTSRPVEVPDPHDEDAVKAAWDLIPSHVMSDLSAWPLKKRD